jgi:hypothetical protein
MCMPQEIECPNTTSLEAWQDVLALLKSYDTYNMLSTEGAWMNDQRLEELCQLGAVDLVSLSDASVTATGLKALGKCDNAGCVELLNVPVSDQMIAAISDDTQIEFLAVSLAFNDREHIEALPIRPTLKVLWR